MFVNCLNCQLLLPPLYCPPYCTCVCTQVGSVNNTFGVQGVAEHCRMFKTIEDAHNKRCHISDCFERAALPNVSAAATPSLHLKTLNPAATQNPQPLHP